MHGIQLPIEVGTSNVADSVTARAGRDTDSGAFKPALLERLQAPQNETHRPHSGRPPTRTGGVRPRVAGSESTESDRENTAPAGSAQGNIDPGGDLSVYGADPSSRGPDPPTPPLNPNSTELAQDGNRPTGQLQASPRTNPEIHTASNGAVQNQTGESKSAGGAGPLAGGIGAKHALADAIEPSSAASPVDAASEVEPSLDADAAEHGEVGFEDAALPEGSSVDDTLPATAEVQRRGAANGPGEPTQLTPESKATAVDQAELSEAPAEGFGPEPAVRAGSSPTETSLKVEANESVLESTESLSSDRPAAPKPASQTAAAPLSNLASDHTADNFDSPEGSPETELQDPDAAADSGSSDASAANSDSLGQGSQQGPGASGNGHFAETLRSAPVSSSASSIQSEPQGAAQPGSRTSSTLPGTLPSAADVADATDRSHTFISSARLLERLSGSEMRMTFRSDALGSVDLRAVANEGGIGAIFGAERPEIRELLRQEAYALHDALREQDLPVKEITILESARSSSDTLDGDEGRSPHQRTENFGERDAKGGEGRFSTDGGKTSVSENVGESIHTSSRLDLLA